MIKIQNHLFKFSASSIDVGFAIYNGSNISCDLFNTGFLLWGPKGPKEKPPAGSNPREQEDGWTLATRSRNHSSYSNFVHAPRIFNQTLSNIARSASAMASDSRPTNMVPVASVFSTLQFSIQTTNLGAGSKVIQTGNNGRISHQATDSGPGRTWPTGREVSTDPCVCAAC